MASSATTMDIFESFCRTCGNECLDPLNIFENNDKTVTSQNGKISITEMLQACAPNSLPKPGKDDNYPKQVCRLCVKKLEMVYEFHTNWLSAHSEFNVALKFEQRRKRRSGGQEREEQLLRRGLKTEFENTTNKPPPAPVTWKTKSVLPTVSIPAASVKQQLRLPYKCDDCDERFYTVKACQFHHKFVHRNCIP